MQQLLDNVFSGFSSPSQFSFYFQQSVFLENDAYYLHPYLAPKSKKFYFTLAFLNDDEWHSGFQNFYYLEYLNKPMSQPEYLHYTYWYQRTHSPCKLVSTILPRTSIKEGRPVFYVHPRCHPNPVGVDDFICKENQLELNSSSLIYFNSEEIKRKLYNSEIYFKNINSDLFYMQKYVCPHYCVCKNGKHNDCYKKQERVYFKSEFLNIVNIDWSEMFCNLYDQHIDVPKETRRKSNLVKYKKRLKFFYQLRMKFPMDVDWSDSLIKLFNQNEVEATSGEWLDALGIVFLTSRLWINTGNSQVHNEVDQKKVIRSVSRWILEAYHLYISFSPTTMVLSFLKVLNEFTTADVLWKYFTTSFRNAVSYLQRNGSPPQARNGAHEAQATAFDVRDFDLSSYQATAPVIAGALASIVTVVGLLICGKEITTSNKNKSLTENMANLMFSVSKFKSGVEAFKSIMIDFSKYIHDCVFELLMGESGSPCAQLVTQSRVQEDQDCKKKDVFTYMEFLLNPTNMINIQSSLVWRSRLQFVNRILEDIRMKNANLETPIESSTMSYINGKASELKKLERMILKSGSIMDPTRFTPFWINIVGSSGTGKSHFTSILAQCMVSALKFLEEKDGHDFMLPAEDNLYFPVNFSDKFLTGYTQQYFVLIDDIFQDNNVQDINSGLNIINWCSSIPHATNQAAVDNKGIPFESKCIISSSNVSNLGARKEIMQPEALYNRLKICIQFEPQDPLKDNVAIIDTYGWFQKPFVAKLIDLKTSHVKKVFNSTEDLIIFCTLHYVQWFKKEKHVNDVRRPGETILNDVNNKFYENYKAHEHQNPYLNERKNHDGFKFSNVDARTTVPKSIEVTNVEVQSHVNKPTTIGVQNRSQGYNRSNNNEGVEPTSSWRCKLYLTPSLIKDEGIDVWNCDCDYHNMSNQGYKVYYTLMTMNGRRPVEIAKYEEFRDVRDRRMQALNQSYQSIYSKVLFGISKVLDNKVWIAMLGLIGGLFYYFMGTKNKPEDEVEPSAQKYETSRPSRVPKPKVTSLISATCYELEKDTNTMACATSLINRIKPFLSTEVSRNSYDLIYKVILARGLMVRLEAENNSAHNCALRICDTIVLTNNHFITGLEDSDIIRVRFVHENDGEKSKKFVFNKSRVYRIPNSDAVLLDCGNVMQKSKNIIDHFPKEMSLQEYQKAMIISASPVPHVKVNVTAKPTLHASEYERHGVLYDTINSYETDCPVEPGMSGSILVSLEKNNMTKILGIQTSRSLRTFNGYFKPITAEQLWKGVKVLNPAIFEAEIDDVVAYTCATKEMTCPPNLVGDGLTYLGNVPKNKCMNINTKTKISPSLIHDEEVITQEPSVLDDFDERLDEDVYGKSIIFRSFEGFKENTGLINTAILDEASRQLSMEYHVEMHLNEVPRRLLTNFENVNGIPGHIKRINMQSSPGYPYVLERKKTTLGGKYEWFDEIKPPEGYGKAYQMKSDLEYGMEQAEKQMKQKQMPVFVAYACLKDETRSLEKIRRGKTRVFICLPLHFNLLIRKYFGAFVAAQHHKAADIASCVGIDPATQWNKIYDRLMSKNPLWEDFDYANWDQHLHPELVMKVVSIVNYWYGDQDDSEEGIVRSMLVYNLIHTNVIVKNRLFVKSSGQCSGCAITAELNCIVHDLLMVYVWFSMFEERGLETSLKEFRQLASYVVYGDDIILSVREEIYDTFNGNFIAKIMDTLGMHITPGDKVSTTFVRKKPHEILFLKRSFVKEGEVIKAPLRSDIIENIFEWIHGKDLNACSATELNCETAVREAFMHNRDYFKELSYAISQRINSFNERNKLMKIKPITLTYESLQRSYDSKSYICAGLNRLEDIED